MISFRTLCALPWIALALVAAACGDDTGGSDAGPVAADSGTDDSGMDAGVESDAGMDAGGVPGEGCDPLVPSVCAFPFPSMRFMATDPASETGFRVAVTPQALPPSYREESVALQTINQANGFSRVTPLTTVFPDDELDDTNLPTPLTLETSVVAESPVQLVDLDTMDRLPVWADLERRGESPDQRALILRPMEGLPYGHRIAAVITDTLRTTGGDTPTVPEGFRILRDEEETDDASLEVRREDFESMFTTLATLGVERSSILQAWQFVVRTRPDAQGALPAMVTAAAAALEDTAPVYSITRCVSSDEQDRTDFGCAATEESGAPLNPSTWRRIYGTVELPSFLDESERIALDGEGNPVISGTFTAPFVVNVPTSLRDAGQETAPVVTFGHGLLASPEVYLADDTDRHGQMVLADRLGAIFIGTRWSGLASDDVARAIGVITDFDTAPAFGDVLAQGMVNMIMMAPFATETLAADPLLASRGAGPSGTLVDATRLGYTGISQGGIFGTSFMALSPYVRTGVLHVPSAGYVNLLPHSPEFASFKSLLTGAVPDLNDQQIALALTQFFFEAGGDPVNYLDHITAEPLTDLGAKNALWQCSEGDVKAPWFGADMMMRTNDFPQAGPVVREIFGVETLATPSAPGTSAFQYFDPQVGILPLTTEITESLNAHQLIRRNVEVYDQTEAYFSFDRPSLAGTVINPCDGPCVIDPVPIP